MFNIVISFEKSNLTPVIDTFGFEGGNVFLSPDASAALVNQLLQAILPRERDLRAEVMLLASRCSETRFFHYHEVLYIESMKNRVCIHRAEDAFEFYGTMYHIEKITECLGFIRVHHAFIVSAEHIRSCNSRMILLDNGKEISIGKSYRQHFREFMNARFYRL